jgi:hypothetical protein
MQIATLLNSATDSEAVIELRFDEPELPPGLSGSLVGPTCAYARTLPSESPLQMIKASATGLMKPQLLLTEPCYWTPSLPFLYQLHLHWLGSGGQPEQLVSNCGFRRLVPHRQSLLWNSRRVVLRGATADDLTRSTITQIRGAEVTVILSNPSREQCDVADREGIALIADLRQVDSELDASDLQRLSACAAVVAILVDGNQIMPCDLHRIAPQGLLAVAVYPDYAQTFTDLSVPEWCDVVFVELEDKPFPADGPLKWQRPIIAIRRGAAYSDFGEARLACDRLQADLAPQFNLAGYFVSP